MRGPARYWSLSLALFLFLGAGVHAQEKKAPGFQAEALWDGRKIVPFKAIDQPPMAKADAAAPFLLDTEYVLGVTLNGESRAYPTRFLWWHHLANDTIGGKPVAISYCSVCNTGIAFDPVVDGKRLQLDFFGLYNGVACFSERETASVLLQLDGRFVTGPLAGKSLSTVPVLDTTWGKWKALHPETLVMSPETAYKRAYRAPGQAEPRGYERFPLPFFQPTVTHTDRRLPHFDKVLAVTLDGRRRAYPIPALQAASGVLNDTLGDTPIAVFYDLRTATANAVAREIDGKSLTFEVRLEENGAVQIADRETGTRWSIEGRGEAGPLQGKTLRRIENHLSQWYGWVAFFPETSIYGRSDPPQGAPSAP